MANFRLIGFFKLTNSCSLSCARQSQVSRVNALLQVNLSCWKTTGRAHGETNWESASLEFSSEPCVDAMLNKNWSKIELIYISSLE